MMDLITRLVRDEEGQGLAEYALILALVAILAVVALGLLGRNISSRLKNIAEEIGPDTL